MKEKVLKIMIAGAGLGGLVAAASMLKQGFKVSVHEQAETLTEVGAGIQISASAVKVLMNLGLGDELEKVGVRPLAMHFRRFDTGEMMGMVPLKDREKEYGAPYYHIHRADLHEIILRKVLELDPECIHTNARVEGFEEHADSVTLKLANGTRVTGDVLVGADGIKSVIRKQVLGPDPVTYTGDISWRAVVPVDRLPANFMERVSTVWCGPGRHAVMYYLRNGTLVNFGGAVAREKSAGDESWKQKRPWEELKADFEGWHPMVQAVIDAVDRDECYQWDLNIRPTASHWSTDRVTLLGDAAHPTLPYMAQGAVMAIEDAAVLTRALTETDSIAEALKLYEQARIPRTSRIVSESTSMRGLYRIENLEQMRKSFQEKDIAKARGQWLYSYDPLNVPLRQEPVGTEAVHN